MDPDRVHAVSRVPAVGTSHTTTTVVQEIGQSSGTALQRPSPTTHAEPSTTSIRREPSREHLILRLVPQRNKKSNKDKKKKMVGKFYRLLNFVSELG